nr:beta-lactamase family protein [Ignavibacterium sp.]
YKKDQIEKIKNLCIDWAVSGETPNVTLIVHKGKIIFYDAFGLDENGKPISKDSKIWMASITKLLTGVLVMQFVDQGLIDLDDPISKYLSEFEGNNKLTVRHLFTHTSGLQFAGEWASDWNVSLENQVTHVLPLVEVGKSFAYHRVGYALAGKIIERLTGKAVPYLFQENIFLPLDMCSAYSDNTYGGLYCSSIDLAKFGQMLLNKGTYNGYKLFSQQTFEKMLPVKLNIGDREWGIGTSRMSGNGLSESAYGHGAASGTTFIIDPENDLIIISARNKPGKSHDEYENALIELCTSLVSK